MLAQFIFRHSRYLALILLCVVAVGITSFRSTITTFYPGATPDRVEALVTRPLEDELRKISEIDELRTISNTGISFVNVKLLETLPDDVLERAWSEVRDAMVDAADLVANPQVRAAYLGE